jgi:hypothetical protein
MPNKTPNEPEGAALTDAVAERLLQRASELDVAERSSAKLAQLRDAAVEAGISATAFDKALAEMRVEAAPVATVRRSALTLPRIAAVAGIIVALLLAALTVGRMVAPAPAQTPRPAVPTQPR